MQERQEMAQVTQAGINHLVGDKLEEADKKRQEAERKSGKSHRT